MNEQRRVRCNHCMSEFDEENIRVANPDIESCPVCGKGDAMMDLENTRPPLPNDVQCIIDAATICKTERHGCYGNNTECLFNRFDNGMGCLNNKHVTRLAEYITTGR